MVNGTRRKLDRAAAPVLPEDLVQWEILVRLPAKEILRCRAACRSWRRLTCDDEFLLAHHHRQPSLPLVSFRSRIIGHLTDAWADASAHVSVDAFDLRRTPAVRRPLLGFNDCSRRRDFSIHGSCDGLLLLSLANHRFYLCNPATRQWLALPALNGGNVAALYPHRPSGEYRVLYWKLPDKCTSASAAYYVLTVGSSEGQRCIGLPMAPSPSTKSDTTRWLIRACEHPAVLLHDGLHWYPGSNFNSKILVFDKEAESFRWMQSPIATSSAHLLPMDGKLCISHIDGDTMIAELWVLQDYETEAWSSKYRVEVPGWQLRGQSKIYGKVVSENGDMLVTRRVPWSNLYLFHCNSKGKLLQEFQWKDVNPMVRGLFFKESIVRHVFFQRNDTARVRVPRFFQGL
ncbi:unnamed protein product [Alopecurus aequalis]